MRCIVCGEERVDGCLEEMHKRLASLQEQARLREIDCSNLEAALAERDEGFKGFIEETERLHKAEVYALKTLLAEARERIAYEVAQVEESELELEATQAKLAAAEAHLSANREHSAELSRCVSERGDRIAAFEAADAKNMEANAFLAKRNYELEQALAEAQAKAEKSRMCNEAQTLEIEDLQAKLAAAEEDIRIFIPQCKQVHADDDARIAALEAELAVWKQNAPTAAKEREALEAENALLRERNEAANADVHGLRAENARLEAAVRLCPICSKHEGIVPAPPAPARPDAVHALGRVAHDIATEKPRPDADDRLHALLTATRIKRENEERKRRRSE